MGLKISQPWQYMQGHWFKRNLASAKQSRSQAALAESQLCFHQVAGRSPHSCLLAGLKWVGGREAWGGGWKALVQPLLSWTKEL